MGFSPYLFVALALKGITGYPDDNFSFWARLSINPAVKPIYYELQADTEMNNRKPTTFHESISLLPRLSLRL